MVAAQESFVAELAANDRAFAETIAVFRGAVTDIASTPPGAAALERFNNGDEVGALAILDRLRAANDRMRQKRADVESAAEGRRIAALALEARTRGKLTTSEVIDRYQEVVRLDPGVSGDWVHLDRLYKIALRMEDARRAVDGLGFQPQRAGHEFPEDRPMRVGAIEYAGRIYRLHVHIVAVDSAEAKALYRFRDVLRIDGKLRDAYQAKKRAILESGTSDPAGYTHAKGQFINAVIGSSAP